MKNTHFPTPLQFHYPTGVDWHLFLRPCVSVLANVNWLNRPNWHSHTILRTLNLRDRNHTFWAESNVLSSYVKVCNADSSIANLLCWFASNTCIGANMGWCVNFSMEKTFCMLQHEWAINRLTSYCCEFSGCVHCVVVTRWYRSP